MWRAGIFGEQKPGVLLCVFLCPTLSRFSSCWLGRDLSQVCKNAGEIHRAQRKAKEHSMEQPWKCQVERSGYIWPQPSSLLFLPCPRNLLVTIFIAEQLSSFRCGAWPSFPKLSCAYMLLLCVLPRSLTFFSCAFLLLNSQRSTLVAFSLGHLCQPHFVLCFP